MDIPIYQVDAFSDIAFAGNPAAVCPLKYWLDDDLMQKIAAENNLAETAFFVKEGTDYRIRWFTPKCEVNLCGHATIAAAYVLWRELEDTSTTLTFHSLSGALSVTRNEALYCLNFPSRPITQTLDNALIAQALGPNTPLWVGANDDRVLLHYAKEAEIAAIEPDFNALTKLPYSVYCVTAVGDAKDFVARVFAPVKGINEDPVTGSAYTALAPFWATKLHKTQFQARQISARGGDVYCELQNDRVLIAGHAVCVMRGTLSVG